MYISARATGRTTKMLKDAVRLAQQGKAVYVIAADTNQRHHLEAALGVAGRELGIKVETPQTAGNFDWQTMSLRGAHQNCKVIADHYAIEAHFRLLLDALHHYDAVPGPPRPPETKIRQFA